MLILSNEIHTHDEDNQGVFAPLPSIAPAHTVPIDRPPSSSSSFTRAAKEQGTFRLRMPVVGFQPDELNVTIRHGRVIVRGRHTVQASTEPTQTSSLAPHLNHEEAEDTEPDFISQAFKRTFLLPPNADIRKANAQFLPQQEELVVEVPFENLTMSSSIPATRTRRRPMDIFLTFITILLMDRALRITYEQFLLHEQNLRGSSADPDEH